MRAANETIQRRIFLFNGEIRENFLLFSVVPALNVANLAVLSFLAYQLRGRENRQIVVKNGSCVVIYSRNLLKMAAAKNDYDLPNLTGLTWEGRGGGRPLLTSSFSFHCGVRGTLPQLPKPIPPPAYIETQLYFWQS